MMTSDGHDDEKDGESNPHGQLSMTCLLARHNLTIMSSVFAQMTHKLQVMANHNKELMVRINISIVHLIIILLF